MTVLIDWPDKKRRDLAWIIMLHKAALSIVLSALCTASLSDDVQRQDQLVWDYAEFVQEFSAGNWPGVARFVGPETKIGFGGGAGMEDLVQVFDSDDECHGVMVQALRQGCRKIGEGRNMHCVSPPQLGPDVIYLGARASFYYSAENDRWMLAYLICGGD